MPLGTVFFIGILVVLIAERLYELWLSRRHMQRLESRDAIVHHHPAHGIVVVLHTLWLIATPVEVLFFDRPFVPVLAATSGAILILAMSLRYWAVLSLGDRWNIRIVTVPGTQPISSGPYRWIRHPNYCAVYLEHLALPLFHSAWFSALVLGTIASLAIFFKSRVEDRALGRAAESDFNS